MQFQHSLQAVLCIALATACAQAVPEAGKFANADGGVDASAAGSADTGLDSNPDAPGCTPASCTDGDPCTVDSCAAGLCSHPKAVNGSSCGAFKVCNNGTC